MKIFTKKFNLFIFFLSFAFARVLFAAETSAVEKQPLKIYVGIYPLKIHQLILKEEKFQADFYIWFRWKGQKKLPGFEIMNGSYDFVGEPEVDELPGGYHYVSYRIKGNFFIKVDLRNYPFDRHRLEIQVENQELGRSKLVYVPDDENMKALQSLSKITGWRTKSAKVFEREHVYETNFGKKEESLTSAYSQLVYRMVIERKTFSYVMKSSFPIFVIVFISFLSLFVYPEIVPVRVSIGITTLLSIVAYHVSQANTLPEVGHLVTADYFFMLAYVCCALSLVETVVINRVYIQNKKIAEALKADRLALMVLPALFIVGYTLIILINIWNFNR